MIRRTFLGILAGMLTPIAPLFAKAQPKSQCHCDEWLKAAKEVYPDGLFNEYTVPCSEMPQGIEAYLSKLINSTSAVGWHKAAVMICNHGKDCAVKTVDVRIGLPLNCNGKHERITRG